MSSRNMCLLPRATLHSDSEQAFPNNISVTSFCVQKLNKLPLWEFFFCNRPCSKQNSRMFCRFQSPFNFLTFGAHFFNKTGLDFFNHHEKISVFWKNSSSLKKNLFSKMFRRTWVLMKEFIFTTAFYIKSWHILTYFDSFMFEYTNETFYLPES